MTTKPYPVDGAPVAGDFEHKALECSRHGIGPHWRPYKSEAPYQCVPCTLELGQPAPAIEAVAAKPGNGHDAAPVKVSEPREVVRAIDEHPARTRDLLAQYEAENTRLQSRIAELERRQEQAIEVLKGGG